MGIFLSWAAAEPMFDPVHQHMGHPSSCTYDQGSACSAEMGGSLQSQFWILFCVTHQQVAIGFNDRKSVLFCPGLVPLPKEINSKIQTDFRKEHIRALISHSPSVEGTIYSSLSGTV